MSRKENMLRAAREKLTQRIKEIRRNKFWPCPECNKSTQVRLLDLVVREFYVGPTGCMEGAYWTEGKSPEFYIACPKCEVESRLYDELKYSTADELSKDERKKQKAWGIAHRYRSEFRSETIRHDEP